MHRVFLSILPLFIALIVGLVTLIIKPPPSSDPYFLRLSKYASDEKGPRNEPVYSLLTRQLAYYTNKEIVFGVYFHGDRNSKNIALTFDADMTRGMAQMLDTGIVQSFYDQKLISVLRKLHTPATLFLAGLWIEKYPMITEELSKDPLFELGSHSYAHQAYASPCYNLEPISSKMKIADLGASQMLLQKYTDRFTTLFRFPGGCFAPDDITLLNEAGAHAIAWDVVANDGFNGNEDSIVERVTSQVKNGSIIVMHMNGYPNEPVDYLAIPKIVERLRQKGFNFVKVSELLGL